MFRPALLIATLALAATPAVANATVLYSTLDQPSDVQGINAGFADSTNWLAQSFSPTQTGAAHLVSFYAQTNIGTGFGTGTMAIYSDASGRPGTELASGGGAVGEVTGQSPICFALDGSPTVTAGATYWAVFRGSREMSWRFSREAARSALFSTNSGGTWTPRTEKTFSLARRHRRDVCTGGQAQPAGRRRDRRHVRQARLVELQHAVHRQRRHQDAEADRRLVLRARRRLVPAAAGRVQRAGEPAVDVPHQHRSQRRGRADPLHHLRQIRPRGNAQRDVHAHDR